MSEYRTRQEDLWAGEFGKRYTERNRNANQVAANVALFSRILSRCGEIRSVIEFGANIGLNLDALRLLWPDMAQTAVEINWDAADMCHRYGREVVNGSMFDFDPRGRTWDLVLSKGLLIHIEPSELPRAYETIFQCASRFIVIAEYFNPEPVTVPYRGQERALCKRDFASEILAAHELQVVDYGFVWAKDVFPQDNINWFLLERR